MADDRWVYGYKPSLEALSGTGDGVREVVLSESRRRGVEEITRRAKAIGVHVRRAEDRELSRLCDGGHHQGVAVRLEQFSYADFEREVKGLEGRADAIVLALDGVQDPMNLGAILRTAVGAGVGLVVLPKHRAAGVTPAAVRASAGLASRVPVAQVTNLARALGRLKEERFWVAGASAGGGDRPWSVDLKGRLVLVLGSEGEGMRRLVSEACDFLVTVPLVEGVDSLNVSVSAAMLMYEAVRQRGEG